MDKVTRQCPQTTTTSVLKTKESRSGIEPRSFRLPAYRLTARPNRLTRKQYVKRAGYIKKGERVVTFPSKLDSPSGKTLGCKQSKQRDHGSIPLRLYFPALQKLWSCGHCLVTLSLTMNETLKWLSSLPILNTEVILVVTVYIAISI